MKRIVLIFGLMLGVILCVNLVYFIQWCYNDPGRETNDLLGYVLMVLMFSLCFFGIRNYRNKQLAGYISLGKAFKVGALIAFVGSSMYVLFWLFYHYMFAPDFMDVYTQHVLIAAEREGADAAALAEKKAEMEEFASMYKNPVFIILITYVEVLPVGLVVSLISAFILKRKSRPDVID